MRLRAFILFLLASTLSLLAYAQAPSFKTLTLGKPKNAPKVQTIVNDQHNHIYFGTHEGLIHYDGTAFRKVVLNDTIPNHNITALALVNEHLWVGTSKGELFMVKDTVSEQFNHPDYASGGKITSIEAYPDGIGFTTYGDGAYLLQNDQKLHHLSSESSAISDNYTYDILYHAEHLWISSDAGISKVTLAGASVQDIKMLDGLPDNIVHKLIHLDDNTIAIGMYDFGVGFLNTETTHYTPALSSEWTKGPVQDMLLDERGVIWVATKSEGVVNIYADEAGTHQKSFTEINGITSNRVNCLNLDEEQNIWIGTQNGVTLYTGSTFEFLTKDEGLENEAIYDVVHASDRKTYLASEVGVHSLSYTEEGEPVIEEVLNYDDLLQVVCLFEASSKHIWMGSYGSGLIRYNPQSGKLDRFGKEHGLNNESILDIAEDKDHNLWLATLGGGVVKASLADGNPSFEDVTISNSEISSYIYSVHIDHKDQIWFGTDGSGLQVLDAENHTPKPLEIQGLETSTVYSITSNNNGAVWFSIAEEGFCKWQNGSLVQYKEASGLRSNSVLDLKVLSDGSVVVVHEVGIDRLTPSTETFDAYIIDRKDFMFEAAMNGVAVDHDALYISTASGVVKFSPFEDASTNRPPKVLLEDMRVMFKPVDQTGSLEFDYDENHVVFQYLGTWMKNPESIVYQYMLEGFDKAWSVETQSTVATYSNLPPGKYTFKVRARNDNGVWSSENDNSLSFTILKPFWMEWWFYLIVLATLGSIVVGYIRYRTKKLLEDKQRLELEVEKRTKEIRHQKNIIEHKNEEILSSIAYAKRIQQAILPPNKLVAEHLQNSFILYKPKDIVAGDFYWLEVHGDWIIFAAADCTGHGVPGAMVSVVCSNALNRAVREFDLSEPAKILDKTLEIVIERFEKSEEEVKDGMDIALCALNTKTNELQFAGAQNPLWLVTSRELPASSEIADGRQVTTDGFTLHEIKADKQPIGKYADPKPFTNHSIQLESGDSIYIFSDGYPDQFGGPKGKKLKTKGFKEFLLSIQKQSIQEQYKSTDEHFEAWRGELEQIDDVCVIGVQIS